jgi:integrase/recombinase XerD
MQLRAAFVEFSLSKDWTPSSQDWFSDRLRAFFDWCASQDVADIEGITAPLVRRFIEYRRTVKRRDGQPISSHTIHGDVRCIKSFLNWAAREDLIDEKVVKRIDLPKRDQKVIAVFTPKQIELLFASCELGETAEQIARDKAILALLIDTGIRANELCTLTKDHVYFSDGDAWLMVDGKGRKQREVGMGKRSRQLLHRYIYRFRQAPHDMPYVFIAKKGTPLTTFGLDQMLYRLRDKAGREHFKGVRVSAHSFRHNYAVSYLQNGGEIYRLARLMGHSEIAVTEGYLRAFNQRDARKPGLSVLDLQNKRQ